MFIATSINRCVRDFPAVGWVRGANTDTSDDLDIRIADYMKKHSATKEDIDALYDEVKSIPRLEIRTEENAAGGDNPNYWR